MNDKELRIVSLERQVLLLNMAIKGMSEVETLKDSDEFCSVLNYIEKLKKDLKRRIAVLEKQLLD